MQISEILEQLERNTGKFPRAAVEAAVASREEITPELLRILEEDVGRARELVDEGDYMAHLYAMFLLAQFRETRAYPLVVKYALLPSDVLDALSGDFVTSKLDSVLASVCGGDLEGIQSIIENERADEWARGAALGSLAILAVAGEKSREEILDYLACLFRGRMARTRSHVWDSLAASSCDLYGPELIGDIEAAYKDGLVDPGFIDLKDVKRDFALGKERTLARLSNNPHLRLIEDTVAEMEWWDCFQERETTELPPPPPPPPIRSTPKVGRNEPCPCGSGKKYKKCCGG